MTTARRQPVRWSRFTAAACFLGATVAGGCATIIETGLEAARGTRSGGDDPDRHGLRREVVQIADADGIPRTRAHWTRE